MSGARTHLRPIERVVLRMVDEGMETGDIATRLRKRPRSIKQIERLARLRLEQDLGESTPRLVGRLRPVELCVLKRLDAGETYGDVGSRLVRSGHHIRRIEAYARFKQTGTFQPPRTRMGSSSNQVETARKDER